MFQKRLQLQGDIRNSESVIVRWGSRIEPKARWVRPILLLAIHLMCRQKARLRTATASIDGFRTSRELTGTIYVIVRDFVTPMDCVNCMVGWSRMLSALARSTASGDPYSGDCQDESTDAPGNARGKSAVFREHCDYAEHSYEDQHSWSYTWMRRTTSQAYPLISRKLLNWFDHSVELSCISQGHIASLNKLFCRERFAVLIHWKISKKRNSTSESFPVVFCIENT